jgi:hypothetical protein
LNSIVDFIQNLLAVKIGEKEWEFN